MARKAYPKGAKAWQETKLLAATISGFHDWKRNNNVRDNAERLYIDYLIEELKDDPISIPVGETLPPNVIALLTDAFPKINRFGLSVQSARFSLKLSEKLISTLSVQTSARIELENCVVKSLVFSGSNLSRGSDLSLSNCWIESFEMGSGQIRTLEIRGGRIENVNAPLPKENGPFNGSVMIKDVDLSSDFKNAQGYRNLRYHLSRMHNQEAASIFHSAEIKTLYWHQSGIDRFFNLVYRMASDYGNSTTRPLIWFLAFSVANFALFVWSDGAVPVPDSTPVGWHSALASSSELRSALITISQIFNPLGVFGLKTLVTAKTVYLAFANAFLCFCATVSLGFFVFALRRRFRFSSIDS